MSCCAHGGVAHHPESGQAARRTRGIECPQIIAEEARMGGQIDRRQFLKTARTAASVAAVTAAWPRGLVLDALDQTPAPEGPCC